MNTVPQLDIKLCRLDTALKQGLVKIGDRFLYLINGAGKCYEGTLRELSPNGYAKLNDGRVWDWPEEVRIEEMLSYAPSPKPVEEPSASPPAVAPAVPLPSAKQPNLTATTKTKR
jgi:hypothetical protein